MKKENIKSRINEFCTLFGFEYNGKCLNDIYDEINVNIEQIKGQKTYQ